MNIASVNHVNVGKVCALHKSSNGHLQIIIEQGDGFFQEQIGPLICVETVNVQAKYKYNMF